MGKSTRIVLLSITAVLAIAVFLVLWTVRPNGSSTLISEARARQSQSLIDIETEVDIDELKAALLADQTFLDSITTSLASDESITDALYASLEATAQETAMKVAQDYIEANGDMIAEEINSYVDANLDSLDAIIDGKISSYIEANLASLDQIIDDAIQSYVDENLPYVQTMIDESINSYVDANMATLNQIIDEAIQAYVDENLPYVQTMIDESINSYVDANMATLNQIVDDAIQAYVDENLPYVQTMIDESINSYVDANMGTLNQIISDAIQSYVDENYDALLALIRDEVAQLEVNEEDLVDALSGPVYDAVLAEFEGRLSSLDIDGWAQSYLDEANDYTDDAIADAISDFATRDDVESLVDAQSEEIVDEVEEAIRRNVVSIPDFANSPTVDNESDYQRVRQEERQSAIDSLISALSR